MACACAHKPKPALDAATRAAILAAIEKMQLARRPGDLGSLESDTAAVLVGHTTAEGMAVMGKAAEVLREGYAALDRAPTLAKAYSAATKADIVGALRSRLDGVNGYAMKVYAALDALPYDMILTATQVAQVAHTVSAAQAVLNDVSNEWTNQTWDLSSFATDVVSRAGSVVRSVAENVVSGFGLPRWLVPAAVLGGVALVGTAVYKRVRG